MAAFQTTASFGERLPKHLIKPIAAACGLLIADVIVAETILSPSLARLQYLFVAVIGVALVFRLRLAAMCVIFVLVDSVFYARYFNLNLGGQNIEPAELLMLALLFVSIVRPKRKTWGGAMGGAMAIFFGILTLSLVLAVVNHSTKSLSDAFQITREVYLMALFFPIVRLFPDRRSIERVLAAGVAVAAITGFFALAASLHGSFANGLQDPGNATIMPPDDGITSVLRVRFPGVDVAYALFWVAVVLFAQKRRYRALLFIGIVGMLTNLLVSFDRTLWLGMLLMLAVILATTTIRVRHRVSSALLAIVAAALVIAVVNPAVSTKSSVYPFYQRATSLFHTQSLSENETVTQRLYENTVGWRTAQHHLLLGVGPAVPFGVTGLDFTLRKPILVQQLWVHNQYLYVVLLTGLLGLAAFLLPFVIGIVRAVRWSDRDPLPMACATGLIGILFSGITMISFWTPDWAAINGVLLGATYVLTSSARRVKIAPRVATRARPVAMAEPPHRAQLPVGGPVS